MVHTSTPDLPVGLGTLSLTVVALLLGSVLYRRYLSPLSDIPGPFWASFSRLWHLHVTIQGNQNEKLTEAHEKYGHFVRLANNEVSVSHPDAIRKVLLTPLEKGTLYKMSTFPDWRYKTPMSVTNPKRKVEFSKQFASGYTLTNALKGEESIDGMISKLLDWMDRFAAQDKPVALDEYIPYLTFDLLGEVLFSKPFGYLDAGKDIGGSIRMTLKLAIVHAIVCHFRGIQLVLLNPVTTKLLPWGHLFNTASHALDERRTNPDARFDILGHWLRQVAQHPDQVTERDVIANTTANIGAGSDTLSCAVQSFVYHMARQPETLKRVRDEISSAQQLDGSCSSRVVSHNDAAKLPFLQACLKEAMRVTNPAPMGLPRIAPKGGLHIGDRTIPQGTTVSVSPWVMHHSKEIWGPDALEFNPDRWLGKDAARLERFWIPFGAGYMSCPGQHIAKMEMAKICATLVRDYDIRLAHPDKPWKFYALFIGYPYDWPVHVSKRASV